MVKIVYRAPKEIVILECVRNTREELIEAAATVARIGLPAVAGWAEGILFTYTPLDPTSTDDLLDQYIKEGRTYWTSVRYALMPKFEPVVKSGTIEIPVLDASSNPSLRDAAIWLKTRSTEES